MLVVPEHNPNANSGVDKPAPVLSMCSRSPTRIVVQLVPIVKVLAKQELAIWIAVSVADEIVLTLITDAIALIVVVHVSRREPSSAV